MIKLKERGSTANERYMGLSEAEAKRSALENGRNILTPSKRISFMRRFFRNLGDPVIKILLCALAVNLIFLIRGGDIYETVGIGISVFLATFISTLSEHGSENAFKRLSDENENGDCRVIREGKIRVLSSSEIVKGDLIQLCAGERIPADCVLISGSMGVDQSAMTGENGEVKKSPAEGKANSAALDPSLSYALLSGCNIISGEGMAIVSAVGDKTFLGGIAREIQTETRESPLRHRLRKLASVISRLGYIAAILVSVAYLAKCFVFDSGSHPSVILMKLSDIHYVIEKLLHAFTLGLTVIVVAVPEGLPMMIAVVLSANIRRMLKDNVLVRKPVGIEAAGSMNILFTDKTGTLTCGHLSVKEYILGSGRAIDPQKERNLTPIIEKLAISGLYNTSSMLSEDKGGYTVVGGNMTDRAITESVAHFTPKLSGISVLQKLPFDSEKKYSSVRLGGKSSKIFIKGAPELLLPHIASCYTEDGREIPFDRRAFEAKITDYARRGERILIIAEGDRMTLSGSRLCLIGAARISDRIRKSARASAERLRSAGIQVVMITGDNAETASRIATECGIIKNGELCLTGNEISKLSDMKLRELLPRIGVIARALPSHKSRLVRIAQEAGLVCGMTGDGINDAPALRCADIGFAMGSGTRVAKDAGDIIILDNDLSSIAKAVLYGRSIFKNIRKFITLQLTMNLSAVGISMIGPFIGFEAPVTVIQMLWINIIMDTLGGLAFAGEAPREEYMQEPPKRREEPILSRYMAARIAGLGCFTIALCVLFLKLPAITSFFRYDSESIYLLTAFFAFYIFSSVISCFLCRTDRLNLLGGITKNKVFLLIMASITAIQILFIYLGGSVLRTAPLTFAEIRATLALATTLIPADFLLKALFRLLGKRGTY